MTGTVPAPRGVLHLCAGNLYGGVERIVVECAASRALAPAMRPAFAVCFDGRAAREIEGAGVRCARLGPVRASRPLTILRARRALARLLRDDPPDTVICHSSWMFALAAPAVRRCRTRSDAPISLVLWVHDAVTGRPWTERWAKRHAPDLVISNSRFTDATVPNLYPDATRAVVYAPVTRRAIGSGSRSELRRSLGVVDDVPVVLLASRMEAWKGHRALIESIASIPCPWHVWIAGGAQRPHEREYEQALRDLASRLGVAARVQFLGERGDVDALMRAADIHCQPNTSPEPFGLAFVEALYAGLPVVTTAAGGALEIVTQECGVLVPPGDVNALRTALERLIEDAALRARLGAAGPSRAASLCDPARQLHALAVALASIAPAELRV
jgi:glycosyltransferase involved in cell wall biosynthesis